MNKKTKVFLTILGVILIGVVVVTYFYIDDLKKDLERQTHFVSVEKEIDESNEAQPTSAHDREFVYVTYDEFGNHPLDHALDDCLRTEDGGVGTTLETQCFNEFVILWQGEIDRLLQSIMTEGLLDTISREKLDMSQQEWNAFKESEFSFIEEQYSGIEGTMYFHIIATQKMMMVRHRALELYNYHQVLSADRG